MKVIEINNVSKIYKVGEIKIPALNEVTFSTTNGEFVAVMGYSGSGKSTLMNIIGCLDNATSGKYLLDGIDTTKMIKNEYANIRNQKIGFVFQGFNLLPRSTALENVELPLMYNRAGLSTKEIKDRAVQALTKVGLAERLHHTPSQLSGGQQQRVAIARALVNDPKILLADEPTGNLDSRTTIEVFNLFQELNNNGLTVILVTHEREFALYAKRIIELRDGKLKNDFIVKNRRIASDDLTSIKEVYEEEVAV